ncbi:MAG TPA: dTDP-4-dehydrorhamnose reductase [Anaerolineae bacterium]|nr:dTDP-4-dehydrorhamnose reductase [Anaerolineae bacterium]HIQ05426.1 dTDP-4-dehydrorhamnose reductase [Anaerolineae bacterium]
MRILITGHLGQLGSILMRTLAAHELLGIDLPEHDITDPAIVPVIADFDPNVVIHTAAYTDVDGAARNPDLAYRINAWGTQNVALACQRANAALVYISTNEVFDGTQQEPYREWDTPQPINPYGASKLAGERVARFLLQRLYIVRIAWLFAPGRRNFVGKILDAAERYGALRVVDDEFGNPTYAPDIAGVLAQLIETDHYGIYHLTNAGHCSRYEFAQAVLERAGRADVPITPISSDEWQRASTPPLHALLANTAAASLGITLRPWQEALDAYFATETPTTP